MSKIIVHVNRNIIDGNRKHKRNLSPITKKHKGTNMYGHKFKIKNTKTGEVIGQIVHQPDNPLSCGAKVWIELDDSKVKVTR